MKKYIYFDNNITRFFIYLISVLHINTFIYNRLSRTYKFVNVILNYREHFHGYILTFFWNYETCLREFFFFKYRSKIKSLVYLNWFRSKNKSFTFKFFKKFKSKNKYIQKGHKILGVYLKDLINNNNYKNLYYRNLIISSYKSYCYLLIRLNRKNLFLTLLDNEGNVLCKTNIGASGFKKKVKRTGYAIKGTGKNFIKIIKETLLKNIFVLYKNIDNNKLKKNIKILKFIENKSIKLKNIKRKKKNKIKIKINKNININIFKKKTKKIIRSKLLWIKIFKNLKKYRIYYSLLNLNNLIKKKLRIILRIKTSLKLWAFRFVVYGLFKKLPWFRGIEFRLPIPHSNGLRLKKKRRV